MKYYTFRELAEMFQVHPETIKREVARNNLNCFRIGTELRFTQEHIDQYTNVRGEGKTTREIELESEIEELKKQLKEKDEFIQMIKTELLKF